MSRNTKILVMGASGNAGMNFILSIKKEFPDIYIYGMDLSHNFYDNNYCYKNVLLPKLDNNDKVEFLNKFCKQMISSSCMLNQILRLNSY